MVKRSFAVAISRLLPPLFLIGFCFVHHGTAAGPLARDTDAYLKSLGLDRNYHKCISVADGDTLTLEGIGTVRLVGVDTPEKNHPKLPIQFLSREASAFTEALCLGKMVRLGYDFNDKDLRGNYGRVLGFAYLEDGTFLQEALIRSGFAIAYTKYPFNEDKKKKFLAWEQQARQKRIGLWKNHGLDEIIWILAKEHPLLQLNSLPGDQWEIVFGNWQSEPIRFGELESQLALLYTSIYEFSPRDLVAWLAGSHYQQAQKRNASADDILLVGMSHRSWGIIYQNHARPRVPQGGLDDELEKLKGLILRSRAGKLAPALSGKRFLRLPSGVPDADSRLKIAQKFLVPDVFVPSNEDIIPWDLADRHIGECKTVEGIISRTHNSGRACFLNFHNNWTRYFSLVIFENVFHRFEERPEDHYLNRHVRVRGKIKLYKGRPEMIINNPDQIEIVNTK